MKAPPGTHDRPCGAEKEPLPPVAESPSRMLTVFRLGTLRAQILTLKSLGASETWIDFAQNVMAEAACLLSADEHTRTPKVSPPIRDAVNPSLKEV